MDEQERGGSYILLPERQPQGSEHVQPEQESTTGQVSGRARTTDTDRGIAGAAGTTVDQADTDCGIGAGLLIAIVLIVCLATLAAVISVCVKKVRDTVALRLDCSTEY